jgi:hypothetical protein
MMRGVAFIIGLAGLAAGVCLAADAVPALDVARILPAPGSQLSELFSVEVEFTEAVTGVDAGDLLINGAAATNLVYVTPSQFLFSFAQPEDGSVAVSWDPNHGIVAAGGAGLVPTSWNYTLDSLKPASSVRISEFMADNRLTLKDEDGDFSDWIELSNSSDSPASLAGWFLTDDSTFLNQWRFPDVSIPGRGFLLVYASAKNKTNATARLHANFKLASGGGYLALVDSATTVVSEFAPAYPPQWADVAYGRAPGEPDQTGYFYTPTPGAANATAGPGFASAPGFSRPGGVFTNRFELSLAAVQPSDAPVVLRYTLDGTLPTNSSPVYTRPIAITNSVQVRARVFQDGLLPGPPRSESYLLLSSNVWNFQSDLPVIVLNTLGKGMPLQSVYTFAEAALFEPVNGRTWLTNPPTVMTRSGIQIRGSSTAGISKSSLKLECWNEFNLDTDVGFFGLPPDSDWVLYAPNQFEPVMIHNPFIHQLSRDMGRYSSRTRFVELFLVRGNISAPVSTSSYFGVYVLEEKIKIGPDRVAIDKLAPEQVAPPEVTGGYLLKIDRLDPGDTGLSAGGTTMVYLDPKEREIKTLQRRPQQYYIRDYFNAFSKALSGTAWRDPKTGYAAFIDVDAWIDFHVLEVLSGNVDSLVLSTYLHKPRNGKIAFGPHWDFDRALGSTDGRDTNPRVWNTGPFFSFTWWNRLFADIDFWQKWVDRWQELRAAQFSLTNLHGSIDRLAGLVRMAQPRDYAKWRIAPRGGSYQAEVNLMKNWLSNRIDFIDKQLAQPPKLSLPGGPVTPGTTVALSGPANATIYYTTNGLDPRATLGAVSVRAIKYTGPIAIKENARIVARAYDTAKKQSGGPPLSTPWSRPVAATYVTATPALSPVEIMFHPSAPTDGGTNAAGDYEFIELENTGATPLRLAGFRLSGAIDYLFATTNEFTSLAAGGRVLVVKNLAAFAARYPLASHVAGEFAGGLGNDSGEIILTGPLQEPICDFYYRDFWAPRADGLGYALVLADEHTAPALLDDGRLWRAGMLPGGSPGEPEPPAPAPEVWINEALTHSQWPQLDAVELYNPNEQPVDISGWYLTDNHLIGKFRFPPGTFIPPHGFQVWDESQFGGSRGFGMNAAGEEIYILSANAAGELTGYVHGFPFGASDPNVSFGRHVSSDGREHFVAQQAVTLGGANAGPCVGPLVIVEFCPQPESGDHNLEFVEIHNIGAAQMALGETIQAWRLAGAVDYVFPKGFILPADGRVIVTGFDGQRDTNALALFRQRYRPNPAAVILGPWQGHLDNTHGRLRLFKPMETPLQVESATPAGVLVDQVTYDIQPLWPALPPGRSLARRSAHAFGDDPANWMPAFPSPGDADSDGDGLPDAWELAYGLDPYSAGGDQGYAGDPDGDQATNWQEYLAQTAPWEGPVYLGIEKLSGSEPSVRLSLSQLPNRGVSLLYSEVQNPGSWQVLTNFAPQQQSATNWVTLPVTNITQFYRLKVR